MKTWMIGNWRSLAFGALSLASVTGCAADVGEKSEETTATTGERATLIKPDHYLWNAFGVGKDAVPMGKSKDTFCFLSDVYGAFQKTADDVHIEDNGTYWMLKGTMGHDPKVAPENGAGAKCVNIANVKKKIWNWPQLDDTGKLDWGNNALWDASQYACFLTGIGGGFNDSNDYVRTYVDANGKWQLGGQSASRTGHASATCIPRFYLYGKDFVVKETPSRDTLDTADMMGTSWYQESSSGPVVCGLTRVGGSLGKQLIAQDHFYWTRIETYQYPVYDDFTGKFLGFNWALKLNAPALHLNAGARCFY